MLIKWGSIVVKGSGKLGGHVFSGGPGGASVHTLAKARNPQTKYQMAIRARFNLLTQGWRDLTESQRESWYGAESEFSRTNRFGDTVFLSGKNLYNALNAQRLIIGLPILVFAPLPTLLNENIVTAVSIEISTSKIFISGFFTGNANYMVVATSSVSRGARSVNDKLRIIAIGVSFGNGGALRNRVEIYDGYVARFGEPKIGDKISIGTYAINSSGQRSTVYTVQAEFR